MKSIQIYIPVAASLRTRHIPNIESNPLRHLRVGIGLLMFTNHTNITTLRLLDLSAKQCQPFSNMDNLANKTHLSSGRYRPQVCHLEVAADTSERELARFGNAQQDSG